MNFVLKRILRPYYSLLRKLCRGETTLQELAYSRRVYFSQFGEDVFLDVDFADQAAGFYVDVGAFHPVNGSNTYVFYRRGWTGINIEPNPYSFAAFPRHRPRDTNLNIAVDEVRRVIDFTCIEELSGIDGPTHRFRNRAGRTRRARIEAMPLREVLEQHLPTDTSIDFMSVDCEGHDECVLRSNDWERYRPTVLLAEGEGAAGATIDQYLTSVGYIFVRGLGMTRAYRDRLKLGK